MYVCMYVCSVAVCLQDVERDRQTNRLQAADTNYLPLVR